MTNGEAVIAKLISEVTDLTRANGLLHAIVSNREEEISGLRAQLASAAATLADIENGLQSAQIRDLEGRLASARKALEEIAATKDNGPDWSMAKKCQRIATAALTDEKGQS